MDDIEEKHQIASVETQFQALQAIDLANWNGVADMQISNRLLALLPKLASMDPDLAAPGAAAAAGGGSSGADNGGRSQLDAAASLMDTLPDGCYTVTFLEELEQMLLMILAEDEAAITVAAEAPAGVAAISSDSGETRPASDGVASSSSPLPTAASAAMSPPKSPAEALSIMLIRLLTSKFADEMRENFQPLKLASSSSSGGGASSETRVVGSESGEDASKVFGGAGATAADSNGSDAVDEAQEMAYGAIFSTVQDCLVHSRLGTRLEACRFIKTVTSGRPDSVYPKVITQQLTTRLASEHDHEVRCALTVAIALCFEPSTLLDSLIQQLEETQSERCRQVAVVCLYSTISDQQLLPKEGSNPFRTLDASLKLYLAETFADLMLVRLTFAPCCAVRDCCAAGVLLKSR